MKRSALTIVCGCLLFLASGNCAWGQTLLERLSQQLKSATNAPEPPTSTTPAPAPPAPAPPFPQPLPAPRDSSAAATPTLGVRVVDLTDATIQAYQLTVRRGALVTAIEKDSPADRAKLPLGAAIVALEGRRINSADDLVRAMQSTRVGQQVELTYYERDRLARKKLEVAAGTTPSNAAPPPSASSPVAAPPAAGSPRSAFPSPDRPLNSSGSRPLLGRLGRLLEGVAQSVELPTGETAPALPSPAAPAPRPAPAPAPSPVSPATATSPAPPLPSVVRRADSDSEVASLRREVDELREQVIALQAQLKMLQAKLEK